MTVGGFWFRELSGVPDWAQDIRIIQEFQGDLIRTVTWTVRISVSSRNAGHSADDPDILRMFCSPENSAD